MAVLNYPQPYRRPSGYYSFNYKDPRTGLWKQKSTGALALKEAREAIKRFIDSLDRGDSRITLRQYAEPFYDWDRCPRINRALKEGRTIGRRHAQNCRRAIQSHVLTDKLADIPIAEIRRAHLIDFRDRLSRKHSIGTVNNVMNAIKGLFTEAYYREDISKNPGAQIGAIRRVAPTIGILTQEEVRRLLHQEWSSQTARRLFMVAVHTGMRAGELLAMNWSQVDWQASTLRVNAAWKSPTERGLPKWNKVREIPLTEQVMEVLAEIREDSVRIGPNDLIFCYEDGTRIGATFWYRRFIQAGLAAGLVKKAPSDAGYVNARGEKIKPHSLRHGLNTHLLDAGADPYKVRLMLGWSDTGVKSLSAVQLGYTHSAADALGELRDLISRLYA